MKIEVTIDKAECFRQGFEPPVSETLIIKVDPGIFSDKERDYIADNLVDGKFQGPYNDFTDPEIINPAIAKLFQICPASLEGFIDAVRRGMAHKDNELPF